VRGYQLLLSPALLYQRISTVPGGVLDVGGTIAVGRLDGSGGLHVYPALAVWRAVDPGHVGETIGHGPLVFQPALVLAATPARR